MKKIFLCIIAVVIMISFCACRSTSPKDEDVAYINGENRLSGDENTQQQQEDKFDATYQSNNIEKNNESKNETTITKITDETEKYLALENVDEPKTKEENPTTKVFELNGEKINLTFKEKIHANKTWYQYDYTDENGIIYMFYEDEGFVGISNLNRDFTNSKVISESEAFEIAKNYATKLFADEFDKYTLLESDFNSSLKTYTFKFYKNYGADNCLKGEVCNVKVYAYGEIQKCYIRNLYVFKSFDKSLVENISQDDIDKLALQLISKKYTDTADWTLTDSSASLQYRDGNWVISVTVDAKNNKTEQTISEFGYFEIN